MHKSVYIRGETDWCLVKVIVPEDLDLTERTFHLMGSQEALEQGCLPSGHKLINIVVDQDESLYNKLWTPEETKLLNRVAVR